MRMPFVNIIVLVILTAVAYYVIDQLIMDEKLKKIFTVILVVIVVLALLALLGLITM